MKYEPALHKPVPMNSRVRLPLQWTVREAKGTVVGISSMHVIFIYIVLLDEAIETEYGTCKAMACPGSELESEDGLTNWRL